jgi:radical SAM protein with 4Fe4S-binding SPASM domain
MEHGTMKRYWCRAPWETRGEKNLGSVHEQSIVQIWNGEPYRRLRRQFHKGDFLSCGRCSQSRVMEIEDPAQFPIMVKPYPRKLYIEPCALCNLRCGGGKECGGADYCPVRVVPQHRKEKILSFETFRRIIDEVYPDLEDLALYNYGEPFLNPDLVKMISYAKKRKDSIRITTATNGHFINSPAKRRSLIESGLDKVIFCVEGPDPETYTRYREGGNFDVVLEGMRSLVALRKEMAFPTPFIEWRYLLFQWNDSDEQMEKARELAQEIGVDRLTWHVAAFRENAASRRFVAGKPDYERIRHELVFTPGSNAIKRNEKDNDQRLREDVLLKKYANQTLLLHERTRAKLHLAGYPSFVAIDPIRTGSRSCPFMHGGSGEKRQPEGTMPFSKYREIVDLLGPSLFELALFHGVEPYLHKNLFDMIRYARTYQVRVRLSTTLSHFSRDKAMEMVLSGLDELAVLAGGTTAETYGQTLEAGDFNVAIQNILYLKEAKQRLGRSRPFLVYQFLADRHNEHEVEGAVGFGRTLGADRVDILTPGGSVSGVDRGGALPSGRPSRAARQRSHVDACYWLWDSMVIHWDGSVHPCCTFQDVRKTCGNFFEQPFQTIWNGETYLEARRSARDGRLSPELEHCFSCKMLRPRRIGSERAATRSARVRAPLEAGTMGSGYDQEGYQGA